MISLHYIGSCWQAKNISIALLVLSLMVTLAESVSADEVKNHYDTFTLYYENDYFTGSDQDYSQGLKLTWSTPYETELGEPNLPEWSYPLINSLPFVNNKSTNRAVSLSLGHDIYTPQETGRTDLITDDRPYAAYLYLEAGFHSRTMARMTSWEFQLGVVGPNAFGEEFQNGIHDLTGNQRVAGWDNQLHNELALEVICETQWRTWQTNHPNGYNFDLIPHLGFRVGNVHVYGNAGAEIRYGWQLPADFGSCPIRSGCPTSSAFNAPLQSNNGINLVGWHFFIDVEGRLVLHDIFLDGNTFEDSHSVDREILVGDVMIGCVLDLDIFKLTYSYVLRTREFDTEEDYHLFGSLNASWRF